MLWHLNCISLFVLFALGEKYKTAPIYKVDHKLLSWKNPLYLNPLYICYITCVMSRSATVLFSNFFSNYSGIFLILPSSESLRFDLSFLIEVLHSSKTTVLCCRILTFWSNLALNIVSTARNDLCFTLCVWSHFESGILKKVRENPVVPGSRAVWN